VTRTYSVKNSRLAHRVEQMLNADEGRICIPAA
jgi:hypothetical protein